jgi:hypothetical protein
MYSGPFFTLILICVISGCGKDSDKVSTPLEPEEDLSAVYDSDGDGVTVGDGDCDDQDDSIHPGRLDACNGVDDNCNGVIDEGHADVDEDSIADCVDIEDCDGIDNNGDGLIDEGFDVDGDGLPDCPSDEICDGEDNDQDGEVDEDFDTDGDGFTECGDTDSLPDCDDTDANIHPGALEVDADLIDNDCDFLIDEGSWVPGDLVITELMINPSAVRDTDGEWVELKNLSGRMLVLNGVEIVSDDDEGHIIAADAPILLPVGASAVLGRSTDMATNGSVDVWYAYQDISLANESDRLVLFADGVRLDEVSWDDGLSMPDPVGASLSVDPLHADAAENDDPTVWCVASEAWGVATDFGTPGDLNGPCPQFDHDGDGWRGEDGDCDDEDAAVYPEAPEITVGVDNDCDGEVGVMPVASADYNPVTSSLEVSHPLYLEGDDSFDPDGGGLSWMWRLDEAPEYSSATTDWILSPSSESPVFTPDVSGLYRFSLIVNDGTYDSLPSRVSVTIELGSMAG